MADDNDKMNVVVTGQGIKIEGAVLRSIKSFESYLEKIPRTRPVIVGLESAAEIEMFMRVYEMLRQLGFEEVSTAEEDDPTWSLYPPMPESETQHGVERGSEGSVDGENDS